MNKSKKTLAVLALVGSLSMVAACGADGGQGAESSQSQESGESQAAAPTPDLEGIPDVVATVNGEEIGKDEFSSAYEIQFQNVAMQAQMSGQEPDQDQMKKQVAESLIGTELLVQQAAEQDITATEDQMAKALGDAAKTNDMTEDEFLAALKEQGTDREQVDVQLKQQVEIEAVVAKEIGEITATEEELKAAYDEQKAMQEQIPAESSEAPELPAFDEVKDQLKQKIVEQKERAATQKLVDDLRADADVEVNL